MIINPTPVRVLAAAGLGAVLSACAGGALPPGDFPTTPPAALAPRPLEFPPFSELTLPNGLRVIVVEHGAQPLAQVTLYLAAGTSTEPAGLAGLAGMTADLLTKGTPTRDATRIAEEIEGVGGTLAASAGADWLTLSSNVLSEHLPLAMEMVSESAIRPTFPLEEVELTRRRTLSSLQSALGQPGQIASRAFSRALYGSGHPYGVYSLPESVEAVTREAVQRFHQDHFGAANALLVVAGDVRAAEVEGLARQYFGAWERGTATSVAFPTVQDRGQTEIHLVHRPGSAQTNIVLGHLGIRPSDPDYFSVQVLNAVLGGTVDARLFQILREQRGWTYGSYSRFTRPLDLGFFEATAEVRPEVTDSAVVEILSQLRRLRDERVPEAELEGAKSFMAGSFPLRIETPAQVAAQIATTRLLGLPIEYVTEFRERMLAVTAEDVQRVARTYIRPDNAVVIVVGDAGELLPRLQPVATVHTLDIHGEAISPADF